MIDVQPICVMYFPRYYSFRGDRLVDPLHLMKELNGWGDIHRDAKDPIRGYIWWCFFKENITEPELKVFHPKNFTKVQYEELKQLVLTEIDKLKTPETLTTT